MKWTIVAIQAADRTVGATGKECLDAIGVAILRRSIKRRPVAGSDEINRRTVITEKVHNWAIAILRGD